MSFSVACTKMSVSDFLTANKENKFYKLNSVFENLYNSAFMNTYILPKKRGKNDP